jgi:hypothetical protein
LSSDQTLVALFRGEIPLEKGELVKPEDLSTARLSITAFAERPDGRREPPHTYTVPLRLSFDEGSRVYIFDAAQNSRHDLSRSGRSAILIECQVPDCDIPIKRPFLSKLLNLCAPNHHHTFVQTGTWTVEVVAALVDGRCLFEISSTQSLERTLK